jgi:uncharacterized protein YaiE (UPF0345 family)
MTESNSYYDGKVKSLGNKLNNEPFTVGIMESGNYTFKTSTIEIMEVIHGEMNVILPGKENRLFKKGESFRVEKGEEFKLSITSPVSYLCLYL